MIIIDALDECDQEKDIRIILQLLFRLQEVKSSNNHQDLALHELPKPVIERDIRLYLEDKLSSIREERSFAANWPGDEAVNELVRMSSPLFIFAATAYRFINRGRHPKKQLQKFLASQEATSASQMDKIYLLVLNQTIQNDEDDPAEVLKEFQDIIGTIILLATPLSIISLARLLHLQADDIIELLDPLHSVLNIPKNLGAPIRILHLSFRDFLINTTSTFHVDEKETHEKIVLHCLRIMNTDLKQNICGLSSYGTPRTNIDNQAINKHLSADLQYSCRYITSSMAFDFMKQHLLHWLEALSLIGVISEAVAMMDMLQSGAGEDMDAEFSNFLYDAKRFILKNAYMASLAPLQLYCSGVVFLPMRSIIRKMFLNCRPKQIHMLPQVKDDWSPGLQTLEGHSDWVCSVAFSPDGQTVVSGSYDNTIKLWDAKTGSEPQTLRDHLDSGHSEWVQSVAFSPDGQTVVSGSYDRTIKLWDAKTGSELQTLRGHSDWVQPVAFSPDGQTVVSGSYDNTIKLWDAKTSSELQNLRGHSGPVHSVAFSPDGQTVVSGSNDKTIKLWDAKTSSELQTLRGHSNLIHSVAFSPDSQIVVSGSNDRAIKLWDAKTSSELQTLRDHLDSFNFNQESLPDNWIALAGDNILWLPMEYRQFTASATFPFELPEFSSSFCSILLWARFAVYVKQEDESFTLTDQATMEFLAGDFVKILLGCLQSRDTTVRRGLSVISQ
ncbi:platelet-activating factor acetylhydrolase isoform 1B alpha subunit, putative [Talaromyces stipitatus ATCC 10500]|uniref:Platelet-activating factor acetylhydrolase isoform 1B alpha subunit, putative n=1 Tax=Talaromyces stipitatus (strain ATCC 10500 / CBS 375.48 / QM 6759 / NRRL 1006) TaxID=441959 RepID=B8M8X2_TALSN|nr:platelet-activating factor acetylhydrolase isoform 1B alpha subunit, putative [Talaromyces stipitatus ATCC 10500]EED20635.1 platelet-activating factor acetylhydrolase isoform 1B alpha subunit, putative [Talaromyces stipitatus ATCC 10500]